MVKTLSELYLEARRAFIAQDEPESAGMLARNLLCHVSGKTPEQVVAGRDMYVGDDVCDAMAEAVQRIAAGEPLAYVIGEWDFYGMTLMVTKDVLIPRDDTCALASLAINHGLYLGDSPRILDLCTGSGCIGLAIASRLKDAKITLADLSKEALMVAKKNAQAQHFSGRVSCVQVDATAEPSAFLGKFDMIVSNPPYITGPEMEQLPDSVKNYEPHMALYGGEDGLEFYRSIAANYKRALTPDGLLGFEFGMGQGDDVCSILNDNGYTILERVQDFNNIERAVIARYDRKVF